ncbi:MAG: HAMP domain-containing histidine kinase [Deltaproteobacteria bacterium]|nr:HAMP domain-containing histidine kinase [Deltaproteobacteria bacterium]
MTKFTIFKRLTFGYVAMMLLVVFLGAYVTLKLNQLNGLTRNIALIDGATIHLIESLSDTIFSQVGFEKKFFISHDRDFLKQFFEISEYCTKEMNQLGLLMDSSREKELFREVNKLYKRYVSFFLKETGFPKIAQAPPEQVYQAEKEQTIDEINGKLKEMVKVARSDRDEKIQTSQAISSQVLKVYSASAGLVIFLGIMISFFNTKSINRSIMLLQEQTKEIAKGKFTAIQPISAPPEIKELADHFNVMSKRLQELDEMKIDFISHVSHELRTPLTVIKEATGMLLDGTYADSRESQQELLTITQQECDRLIGSVNRILDLSRMEAKMMEYVFEPCPLPPLIQETVLKLAPIAIREEIRLQLKLSDDLPQVKMDEARIKQVLENLISNALKFSSKGDTVSVNTEVKRNGQDCIQISVSDTGTGIQKENLERIFDRFKRIEHGKETARGTGLGLSIAKHIVTEHGGIIWAESAPGKGSTFFFTLPVS